MQEPDAFIPLASIVVSVESFDAILQQVVDMASAGMASCSMAGITLLGRSGPTTTAATSEVAGRVDATQYQVGSGPCLDAYRYQVVNRIEATESDERWPEFSRVAYAEGVLSTLSLPLIVGGDGLGALNLYSDEVSGFDDDDERIGTVFATHASVTLANARTYWATEELRRNLEIAMETRGVIELAKGILVGREGCSPDEAFEILRRASQRENRKLRDIAQEMVDGAWREN